MEFRALNQAIPRKTIVKRCESLIDMRYFSSENYGIAVGEIGRTT